MLKIKDGVDLSELEKFGFTYNESNGTYVLEYFDVFKQIKRYSLYISANKRSIESFVFIYYREMYILYDLIQAGLVEKVEEC